MKKYLIFFFISLSFYTARTLASGQGVYGDGNAYFSYAHALTFKHSLDFSDIYHHLNFFQGKKYQFKRAFWRQQPTTTGKLPNQWLIGPALFWLPPMLLAKFTLLAFSFDPQPYHLFWEYLPGLTSIVLGLTGLYTLEKSLCHFYAPRPASLAIIFLFSATHLFYYLALEPVHSHSIIFFLISIFIYLLTLPSPPTHQRWLALGLTLGLAIITRPSGIAAITLLLLIRRSLQAPKPLLLILVSLSAGVLPQLLTQKILFGSFLSQPYLTGYHGQAHFSPQFILPALLSPQRGLFAWTPILLIALYGLVRQKKHLHLKTIFFIYLFTHLLIVGTWNGNLSAGFGNRFFIETLPIYAFGFANFFSTKSKSTTLVFFFLSLYWNLALLTQFFFDPHRLVDLNELTYPNLLTGQITLPLKAAATLLQQGFSAALDQYLLD